MAKSIFEVDWIDNRPDIPPFEAENGIQLYYTEDGVLKGGYSLMNQPEDGRIDVMIWASVATIDCMKADPKYTWIEDIIESEE